MAELKAADYPGLCALIDLVDRYLARKHPGFFGPNPIHPRLPLKTSKVIHDNLWGTNAFSWQELVIIDSPILQRLRFIHQTGLAFHVYPSAHHTRFEHSLGVATVASRIFDSLLQRQLGKFRDIVRATSPEAARDEQKTTDAIAKLRQELRLAALLHDTGHSLFSHSSEQVFARLDVVENASEDLARMVGKKKGAGESIAFAVAMSPSVRHLLERARSKLSSGTTEVYSGPVNMLNVALMIAGRARHPYLQFLADIISSGFDADKLDYLLRDATSAGLPLRYDFERYLYAVRIEDDRIADGENELERLFAIASEQPPERIVAKGTKYPYFEACRLRLPSKAMNTIEQIVICKLMLFSYIYHHPKVRAAEGLLVDVLQFVVDQWRNVGVNDDEILCRFMDLTDSAIWHVDYLTHELSESAKAHVEDVLYRLANRLLPREVYRIGGAVATGPERALLADFLTALQDKAKLPELIANIKEKICEELQSTTKGMEGTQDEVGNRVGLRVDVPKAPKFEDVDELVIRGESGSADVQLLQVFPISQWTHAYTHFRFYVRIFCYSEFVAAVHAAAKKAMKQVIRIESEEFYQKISRVRND